MTTQRRPGSLRLRLLGATLATLALALVAAHAWLAGQFREHVLEQFDAALLRQLDQVTARLAFDEQGLPTVDTTRLSDPRWERPFAGLYWQLQGVDTATGPAAAPLRSRSLWDAALALPAAAAVDGALKRYALTGPRGEALRAVERVLRAQAAAVPSAPALGSPPTSSPLTAWRLVIAGDAQEAVDAAAHFDGVLAVSLAGLGALLALAALGHVAVGLAPLRAMQRSLQQVRQGRQPRLQGRFPAEVQPLIDEFNGVLDRNAEVVQRAREQAGNLAHALKTPLAILNQAARDAPPSPLAALVDEQAALAQRQVQWHLARARAAAAPRVPGQRTALEPLVHDLLRTMDKLHAARHLDLAADAVAPDLAFAGAEQDLQEMLGNLLDNACRSARTAVSVGALQQGPWLQITVDDDGRGIPPAQRAAVLQRGVRLDESGPGSGLGLAIVVDLARGHGGELGLETAPAGGLRARLTLPGAATVPAAADLPHRG